MRAQDAFVGHDRYDLLLIVLGVAMLAAAALPRVLWHRPFSMPIPLLLLGYAVFALPLGLDAPDPMKYGPLTERLTEIAVIVALMGAGLKIDRNFGWREWQGTWRLLGITMVLSIGMAAVTGWWLAGFVSATAILLGAVIAPTDPVLASEIQVGGPQSGSKNTEVEKPSPSGETEEDEFRFILTSEAGLNDGLAFPFTNAAIAVAVFGLHPAGWFGGWLVMDVFYKLICGAVVGWVLGRLLAALILAIPGKTRAALAMIGPGALAATLIIYGVTEYVGGYGFIATFVGAMAIRSGSREHEYHESLYLFTEMVGRLLTAGVLVAFGGAIAGGLLDSLTWPLVLLALAIVFVIRPLTGMLAMIGFKAASSQEKIAISFFGVRGVGSFYYLAYALNLHAFPSADRLWAVVGLVVVISIFIHGIAARPVTRRLDLIRKRGSALRTS